MGIKTLLYVDEPNWANDRIAKDMVKYCGKDFCIPTIYYQTTLLDQNTLNRFEVIHCLGAEGLTNLVKANLNLSRIKKVITIASHRKHNYLPVAIGNADVIICTSERLCDQYQYTNKATNIPNGIDLYEFRIDNNNDREYVGHFSSHSSLKGYEDFILPSVLALDEMFLTNPTADRIRPSQLAFPQELLVQMYNLMYCYICASEHEGFCLPLIEAAACGVPVLSTDVGIANKFIIDGENGFIIKRDIEDIKEKIQLVKENQQSMRNKTREAVGQFDWTSIMSLLYKCYE